METLDWDQIWAIRSCSICVPVALTDSFRSAVLAGSTYNEANVEPMNADIRLLPVVLIRNLSSSWAIFSGPIEKPFSDSLEISTTSGDIGEYREFISELNWSFSILDL